MKAAAEALQPDIVGGMSSSSIRRSGIVIAILLATMAMPSAQGERFEGTLPFKVDVSQPVAATVGPVKVSTLKVTNLGRGYGRGGFGPKMNATSELSTVIRLAFDANNPRDEDWEVTFSVELLDRSGKSSIAPPRRSTSRASPRSSTSTTPSSSTVLPLVHEARITLQARID